MIVKPSPETPFSVLALAHLAEQAGFAKGVFSVLTTSLDNTPDLSEALCRHPLVKKVTFTGSTRVGKSVAKICSDGLKKCTLELGGNCPFLVFDDADLEQAATQLMALKWRHAGQACITANRVYVQKGVYDQFAEILAKKTKELVVGHGGDKKTTMGPVTTERSLDKALAQVEDAKKHGGKLVMGGKKLQGGEGYDQGYFFEPTIITGASGDMLIAREETFAPVLALFSFDTEEEAVKQANNTSMGLASCKLFEAPVLGGVTSLLTWRHRLLHEEHRSHLATVREPRGRYDWHEHWQLQRCRNTFRWYQGVRLRQGVWQRRCHRRVHGKYLIYSVVINQVSHTDQP